MIMSPHNASTALASSQGAKTTIQTQNNQCTVNNGNNNITINIRNYGHENRSHITADFMNGRGLYNLIKSIHFNNEHPENHNIRKHDSNDDWFLRSFKSMTMELIKRYKDELCQRIVEEEYQQKINCDITLKIIIDNIMKFDMDRTPSHFYTLVEDLERKYQEDTGVIAKSSMNATDVVSSHFV
jgi:hypothetical protein